MGKRVIGKGYGTFGNNSLGKRTHRWSNSATEDHTLASRQNIAQRQVGILLETAREEDLAHGDKRSYTP
jgi:hypothetical protein